MPLNKLENFIKNTEGRILYVNPSDLDSTDSIDNQGNSLTKPFKTIQRALIEAARFSYLKGTNNDLIEKTTILLFPGEYIVDNRPGFGIRNDNGTARARNQAGGETLASVEFSLTSSSVFDLTQSDNILYKFNSTEGGVIVPRGTSIVGLDLRKTKIRPKYVPNPTDINVRPSSIFKITGACYFWQFSIFDGDDTGLVYTDNIDFSINNQSTPTFSHHKLTCFEYADGVNVNSATNLTDLDMYFAKLSYAFSLESGRDIDQKFPTNSDGFAKMRPEWEIVGAFSSDPVNISSIISGDGITPGNIVTVTTETPHNLTAGNPIKINSVGVDAYNISTKVQNVINATQFTYVLPFVPFLLDATPPAAGATVTIETDTVSGASPYIFNISLRSVFGMQGMHADGRKASGFRSMVVAQFTAVSLQKDDRAFVRYNVTNSSYEGITVTKVTGSALSDGSSSTNAGTVYHLDSQAMYRNGWETSHIKVTNDSVVQIVSVFAIGFTKHFEALSGGDASITNSNSNFGQLSLASGGFKREAFTKDNRAYVTSIITPKSMIGNEENIEWVGIDTAKTQSVGIATHLYLYGYSSFENKPPEIVQGYRIGARVNDVLYISPSSAETYTANILMADAINSSYKEYVVTSGPTNNIFTIPTHTLQTGEEVIIISDTGNLPENIIEQRSYYVIVNSSTEIRLASSLTNALNGIAVTVHGGTQLRIISRVSDKASGELGSPIQWDSINNHWYLTVQTGSTIYTQINTAGSIISNEDISYVKRIEDTRSLDEKLYKLRVVIPKEFDEAKNPEEGFIIQESSYTGYPADSYFTTPDLNITPTSNDYLYNRNPRFISTCSINASTITVLTDLPHNLEVGEHITIRGVTSTNNTTGQFNFGYNGTFAVAGIINDKTFTYNGVDIDGITHEAGQFGTFTNNINNRTTTLPRFERVDNRGNYYVYRKEVITDHIPNVQDGIYHFYVLNSSNTIAQEFTTSSFSQSVTNLYPELDRDNLEEDPKAARTFARNFPIADVVTNDLKKSITRETVDKFLKDASFGIPITGVTTSFTSATQGTATITFSREHNLNSIVGFSALAGGSGYTNTNGTFYNVRLFNNGTTTWDGATAKVSIAGGSITGVDIISGGSGYTNGEELDFDPTLIGAGVGAGLTISTSGISTVIGNTVQVTGIGTTSGGHFRITAVPATNQVAVAITNGDPKLIAGQYLFNIGPDIVINSSSFASSTQTFITQLPHGLLAGNKITILNETDANLGNYYVSPVGLGTTSFEAKTNVQLTNPKYVLKHGTSVNDATSDVRGENLGIRGVSFYDNESLILVQTVNNTTLRVSVPKSGISTTSRFPLGSYIQVDEEIMRIRSSTLSGASNDEISVIRGVLGTIQKTHSNGSLIKKIKPYPVEFRRPSYLRASGHTFEYVGFGPGNYSTALPQVQVRSLTEKEEYLAQAQERSGGIAVYTGMNNDGDFFIGNKRVNSATGQEKTFDIPIPTITGLDPSRLSVVFDEVISKERILVEGGNSGQILSQFNGPVNFNKNVKVKEKLTVKQFKLTDLTESNSVTTGALIIDGGIGVGKNLFVGGLLKVNNHANITGILTVGSSSVTINGTTNQINIGSATINQTGINLTGVVTATTFNGALTGNVTGNVTGNLTNTVTGTNSTELVRGNMADNDQFRILIGGTSSNAGFVEIATADDGTEPIHVRQYMNGVNGSFTTLMRTATLLDASGNTSFPGTVTVAGNIINSGTLGGISGATALTLSGSNVTVAGDLTVTGNDISSSSAVALTLSGSNVTVAGALTVAGNAINSGTSGGISGATALTLSGENVTANGISCKNLGLRGDTAATSIFNISGTGQNNTALVSLGVNGTVGSILSIGSNFTELRLNGNPIIQGQIEGNNVFEIDNQSLRVVPLIQTGSGANRARLTPFSVGVSTNSGTNYKGITAFAWARFNGSIIAPFQQFQVIPNNQIESRHNVASITHGLTAGTYFLNFITPATTTDVIIVGSAYERSFQPESFSGSNSVQFRTTGFANNVSPSTNIHVVVFGPTGS